jgi:hypothetical protein
MVVRAIGDFLKLLLNGDILWGCEVRYRSARSLKVVSWRSCFVCVCFVRRTPIPLAAHGEEGRGEVGPRVP